MTRSFRALCNKPGAPSSVFHTLTSLDVARTLQRSPRLSPQIGWPVETFEWTRGKIIHVKAQNVEGMKRELFAVPELGRELVPLQQPASWILHLSAWWKPLLQSGPTALWRASSSTARTACTYYCTNFFCPRVAERAREDLPFLCRAIN